MRVAHMQRLLQLHLLNHQLQDSSRTFLDLNFLRIKKLDRSRECYHKHRKNGFTAKECAMVHYLRKLQIDRPGLTGEKEQPRGYMNPKLKYYLIRDAKTQMIKLQAVEILQGRSRGIRSSERTNLISFHTSLLKFWNSFLPLIAAEQEAADMIVKERLSTWPLAKQKREGYCLTGLYAYWMNETHFGRPVAAFRLRPDSKGGKALPNHVYE